MGRFQALLGRYRDACYQVPKRFSDKVVLLEAGREAGTNKAEDVVSQFLRGLGFSTKQSVREHIAHLQASVNEHR